MGTFTYKIAIAAMTSAEFEETEALVDSGSTYTWIPRPLLERLGVTPQRTWPFEFADGRRADYPMAWVRVKLNGQTGFTLCVFGEAGTRPLLGAVTLEEFGLAVDPVKKRLVPVPGLLMTIKDG